MQTSPRGADLPSAHDHLQQALEILDDSGEFVIAARVSDVIDLLNAVLPSAEG